MTKIKIVKRIYLCILLLIICFSLVTCTAGPNTMKNAENPERKIAGFWQGLWHGLIVIVTFIISLFNKNINIYEIYNNGGWYNLGFLFGVMIIFGGSSGASARASCSTWKSKPGKEQKENHNE